MSSLNLKAKRDLYVVWLYDSRSLFDRVNIGMESEFMGLKVHELLDQESRLDSCLLIVLVQYGMLQIKVLLISGEKEL